MLDKRFDFGAVEARFSSEWEQNGCFDVRLDGRPPFAIMMPPPNVTGTLHLGHALDNTLPDILVRRARMQGKDALYQPGTDHASIAVHVVLERGWAKEGKTRFDFGREAFMEKAWAWKDHSASVITTQLRRLGISCDWKNERFTMDPAYTRGVEQVFIELYNRGLIYRGQRLVNWDPNMQTAVSDLEVKHKEVNGNLWHFKYKFADGGVYDGRDGIEIATTRPETILADGAIAINPEDPRAADLVGRKVLVPIMERPIPIVADDMVDKDFGSGMVKITAAHDFNDFAFYQRHKDTVDVALINLLTPDGKMNANCPDGYVGLDRFAARKKIVADLDARGHLIKVEPHTHNVGHAERDDTVLEPYLTYQWYVKGKPLADKCLLAAEAGDVTFANERDAKIYRHWLENIQDWCISRQLWWGHRIPAWYKGDEIYVGERAPAGEGWVQDNDILDTWFSSALWPFVTQGWPNDNQRLQTFYPGALINSGRDILFFWLIRMMMMGLELTGKSPFQTIYTHGLILDEHGQKMSKSKGNVVDPMGLLETYGADAVRFGMASISSSDDMRFSESKIEHARNFTTKLWNAARFLVMQDVRWSDEMRREFKLAEVSHPINRWVVNELQRTMAEVDAALDVFAFHTAAQTLEKFVWNVFCDWYLELTKPMLAEQAHAATRTETKLVMAWVFDMALRGLHPFMPFITEAVWENHTLAENTYLMLQPWPDHTAWPVWANEGDLPKLMAVVDGLRTARSGYKVPPKARVQLYVRGGRADWLREYGDQLQALAGIETIEEREAPVAQGEALVVVDGVEYILPLLGLVDMAAEAERLARERAKLLAEMEKLDALLNDAGYLERAPAAKVESTKARRAELEASLAKLGQTA